MPSIVGIAQDTAAKDLADIADKYSKVKLPETNLADIVTNTIDNIDKAQYTRGAQDALTKGDFTALDALDTSRLTDSAKDQYAVRRGVLEKALDRKNAQEKAARNKVLQERQDVLWDIQQKAQKKAEQKEADIAQARNLLRVGSEPYEKAAGMQILEGLDLITADAVKGLAKKEATDRYAKEIDAALVSKSGKDVGGVLKNIMNRASQDPLADTGALLSKIPKPSKPKKKDYALFYGPNGNAQYFEKGANIPSGYISESTYNKSKGKNGSGSGSKDFAKEERLLGNTLSTIGNRNDVEALWEVAKAKGMNAKDFNTALAYGGSGDLNDKGYLDFGDKDLNTDHIKNYVKDWNPNNNTRGNKTTAGGITAKEVVKDNNRRSEADSNNEIIELEKVLNKIKEDEILKLRNIINNSDSSLQEKRNAQNRLLEISINTIPHEPIIETGKVDKDRVSKLLEDIGDIY